MLDVFHIAKPQGCDIQIFYGDGSLSTGNKSWIKPRGVSHVYMLLIGAGAAGNGTNGGASGVVTVWYGAAQHVPDYLRIQATIDGATQIRGQFSSSTLVTLLQASAGTSPSAVSANFFGNMGFYTSTAGQNGSTGDPGASATTFLSGGGSTGGVTGNYGYSVGNSAGLFQTQPIIVGVGGAGANRGGIGCGGGLTNATPGGQGMVLIASW